MVARRVLGALAGAALLSGVAGGTAHAKGHEKPTPVIVRAPGAIAAARTAVTDLGGRVTKDLSIVDGFAAQVPADTLPALRATKGVAAITPDARMTVQATAGDTTSSPASVFARTVGADDVWATGNTGQHQTVALIDPASAAVHDPSGRI